MRRRASKVLERVLNELGEIDDVADSAQEAQERDQLHAAGDTSAAAVKSGTKLVNSSAEKGLGATDKPGAAMHHSGSQMPQSDVTGTREGVAAHSVTKPSKLGGNVETNRQVNTGANAVDDSSAAHGDDADFEDAEGGTADAAHAQRR